MTFVAIGTDPGGFTAAAGVVEGSPMFPPFGSTASIARIRLLVRKVTSVVCMILFGVFMLLAALTMMNMLIGVLCECVKNEGDIERDRTAIYKMKQSVLETVEKPCLRKLSHHLR